MKMLNGSVMGQGIEKSLETVMISRLFWKRYRVLIEFPRGGFNRGQGGSLAKRGFKVNDWDVSINWKLSYRTSNNVPAPIKMQPISDLVVNCSCRNTNASTSVMTTLSLSIGTTLEASPI